MGQGLSVDTPEEAADLLLKRDYPEIYNVYLGGFGTIAVPEGFIPTITKVIDQDVIDNLDEETRKIYKDMIKKFPGDTAERIVHQGLKDYYKKIGSDTVIVQGLEIINLSSPGNHRECDFIIVNLDKRYILNIEVKNFLGPWIWNQNFQDSSQKNLSVNQSKSATNTNKKQKVTFRTQFKNQSIHLYL